MDQRTGADLEEWRGAPYASMRLPKLGKRTWSRKSARTLFLSVAALVFVRFIPFATAGPEPLPPAAETDTVLATPADEITRAVWANGVSDVKQATAKQFIRAFSAVLVRVGAKEIPSYVCAAIKLRPDLAPQITEAALVARAGQQHNQIERQISCEEVNAIIRAAIACTPDARDAIVCAAVNAVPGLRRCILAAAGVKENELAFFHPPCIHSGDIVTTVLGTINPRDISSPGPGKVSSPEQPPGP